MSKHLAPARRVARLRLASRAAALLGVAGLASSVVLIGLGAAPAGAAGSSGDAPAFRETRELTREHVDADGSVEVVDRRNVTVTVDKTENLRGRERLTVSWSGAHPSGARAANPYGAGGSNQEYPVVILLCRGLDDADLPVAQRLRPETCWTSVYTQRFGNIATSEAVWQHDRYADAADRADPDPATWPEVCPPLVPGIIASHLLPFEAANKKTYPSCSSESVPPESALDSALPPAELAAFTRLDGTGDVQVEVRSAAENESLGCSSEVPCSLVVIPIMGISCDGTNAACRADGAFQEGSSNFLNVTVDAAVSPLYWWSESNWRNRFAVPLTFGLPADACDVLDDRPPVGFYGSELMAQAALQWAPAYCLRDDRFKFRHFRQPEHVALGLLDSGQAVAALVTEPAADPARPLGYAPVAVTGFAVAFVSDRPDNAGEVGTLRLTPRLLAKLMTQSYPASPGGRGHPGIETNPLSINLDPEFQELNPGLDRRDMEATAALLWVNESSDVMAALTEYIAEDDEAMAFVAGEADPWGMVVNPYYKGIDLPRRDWPQLDTWVKPTQVACEQTIKTPYLNRVAAPVGTYRTIAEAVLDAWPNVQTTCTRSVPTDPWKQGRIERQAYGYRFMLGLVSLGDAERYGLHTAELRTAGTGTGATFVAPTPASMTDALGAARSAGAGQPFLVDQAALADTAYPGTMVVHAAAPLSGLSATDAGHVSQFIHVATTEGQVPGRGNGELPAGFVPIQSTGATAPLYSSAQAVATAVAEQKGAMTPPPSGGGGSTPTAPPRSTVPSATPTTAPVSGLPADEDDAAADAVPAYGRTEAQTSKVGSRAVPVAFGVGLAGLLGAPLLQAWTRRRRLS